MQDTIRITIHQNGCMFKDMVDQEVAHLETGTPAVESNMRQLVLVALMEAMDMIAFMLQHLSLIHICREQAAWKVGADRLYPGADPGGAYGGA